ncbi:MAG: PIN domain-containing protein [Akkermansiaceae bacterium]|nr:PIN domain-containing protein [Akkermansiaceae bacterium]
MARLIESSLWIDFTRAKSPPRLKATIHPWILDPDACLCEPVAFKVLRHATRQERKRIEAQFATLPLLATPPLLWRDAMLLGQQCCDKGFTAGSLDLVIAALAIHHSVELVTFDEDFAAISRHTKLQVRLLSRPQG